MYRNKLMGTNLTRNEEKNNFFYHDCFIQSNQLYHKGIEMENLAQ